MFRLETTLSLFISFFNRKRLVFYFRMQTMEDESSKSPWICGPTIRFDQDIKDYVEIRPGRKVMIRKVTFHSKASESVESCDMMEQGQNKLSKVAILFVHGSCAASSQFSQIVQHLGNCVKNTKKKGEETRIHHVEVTQQTKNENEEEEEEKKTDVLHHKCDDEHESNEAAMDAPAYYTKVDVLYCRLFDFFGCGESNPELSSESPPFQYKDYSERNMELDLEFVLRSLLAENDPVFIVAHSYATSQVIKLLNSNFSEEKKNIRGAIFIGGALKDCPNPTIQMKSKDGGMPLFQLPHCLLNFLQPAMSKAFVEGAFHPSFTDETVRTNALQLSNANSMRICQAFYRQKRYATSEDAKKFHIQTLVIHGQDDLILPVVGGEHLSSSLPCCSDFITIPNASHQVFEEKPKLVGDYIFKFICDNLV